MKNNFQRTRETVDSILRIFSTCDYQPTLNLQSSLNKQDNVNVNEDKSFFQVKVKVKIQVQNKNLILNDVYYLPFSKNIIILSMLMEKGLKIIGNKDTIEITKNNNRIIPTSKIKTKNLFIINF